MRISAKSEPSREILEKYFDYTEEIFNDGSRRYIGGFLWLEHTLPKRPMVRKRLREHGTTFAGGVFSHPRSGLEYPTIRIPIGAFLTHRLVWTWHHGSIPEGAVVDHINRDSFDNRVRNLRLVNHSQNHLNRSSYQGSSSRYVGVFYRKDNRKWSASVKVNGKTHKLGCFDDEVSAAKARDRAALKHYGEFAHLNFPTNDNSHWENLLRGHL